MTAKEYLRQLINIDVAIQDYQDEVLKIRAGLERMTPQLSGMPNGTPDPDKFGGKMDGLFMWQDKLNEAIDEACTLKTEALTIINLIQDQTLRKILFKHYIACKPFVLIAVEMGYEYYWTCQLHGKALQEFDKVVKEHKQTQLEPC